MKHTKTLPLKQKRAPAASDAPWRLSTPRWAIALMLILLSALVTFGLFENVFLSHVPLEMLGTWEVVAHESHGNPNQHDLVGWTFEFERNGSLMARNGNQVQAAGAYFKDDSLQFKLVHPSGTQVLFAGPIVELTATDLVMEDAHNGTIRMQRLGSR